VKVISATSLSLETDGLCILFQTSYWFINTKQANQGKLTQPLCNVCLLI